MLTTYITKRSFQVYGVQFFCPACGIATTSEINLKEHLSGRKHARRVQHLAKASAMLPTSTTTAALGTLSGCFEPT